ncbi:MAG: trypsin-like peptidase domain-containing protein [Nitrospiraceae bacterium]|nr:trypsin-like peptidase domain-containing protein [Nitrospiraceae bacterium]
MAGWIDHWRAATVAIGQIEEGPESTTGRRSARKFFSVSGTGVLFSLYGVRRRMTWLVTAKHVLYDPEEQWEPTAVGILFPRSPRGRMVQALEVPLQDRRRGKRRWIAHPDPSVDLACLPLPVSLHPRRRGGPASVAWMDIATTADLYEGAPVVVLGYPAVFNLPDWPCAIVRQGMVSWVSPRSPGSQVFLIDSHVYPGNSGGPVFRLPAMMDRQGHMTSGGPVTLLGIVTRASIQSLPLLAGGKPVELHYRGKRAGEPLLSRSFLGLGMVEPAYRIKQLLVSASRTARRRRRPTA